MKIDRGQIERNRRNVLSIVASSPGGIGRVALEAEHIRRYGSALSSTDRLNALAWLADVELVGVETRPAHGCGRGRPKHLYVKGAACIRFYANKAKAA